MPHKHWGWGPSLLYYSSVELAITTTIIVVDVLIMNSFKLSLSYPLNSLFVLFNKLLFSFILLKFRAFKWCGVNNKLRETLELVTPNSLSFHGSIKLSCLLLSEGYLNSIIFSPIWVIKATAVGKQVYCSLKFNTSYKLYIVKLLV